MYNQERFKEGLAKIMASINLPLTFGENPRFVHFMHKYTLLAYQIIFRNFFYNNIIKSDKNYKQLII